MKDVKIFLLDLNSSNEFASKLAETLGSFPNLRIRVKNQSLKDSGSDICDLELCNNISRSNSDLILMVLSSHQLEWSRRLIQSLTKELSSLPIIVVFKACNSEEIFSLLKVGAADFIISPFRKIDFLPRLWRLLEHKQQVQVLPHKFKEKIGLKQFVGKSPAFLNEIKKIPIVARYNASVMIKGKTGTGKELCARAIHYLSPRSSRPFVPLNCGAVPTDLMENELFGHVQGAFTGASASQPGLVNEANRGTLFLDDVDCLPLLSQVKLLRFLQEKEYRQLGSSQMRQADVRVIAATSADLEKAVEEGELRQDLYYRLNIIPLTLPSLQERLEDIPLLAGYFAEKYAVEFNKNVAGIDSAALEVLMYHEWPGNVRELEHVIERAVLFAEQSVIRELDIILPNKKVSTSKVSFQDAKAQVIKHFEKNYIIKTLIAHHGNISKAAQSAQKNRRAFWQLMRKHQIDVKQFKPGQLPARL